MIEDLEKSKAQLAEEIDQINGLIEDAASIAITDPQRCLPLVKQVEERLERFKHQDDPIFELLHAKLSVLRGGLAYASSNYQGLIQRINLAIPALDQWPGETKWRARSYRLLGSSYAQLGDKENLVRYLRIALDLARSGGHKREMATTLNVLAYYEEPQTKIALYQEALGLLTETENPMARAAIAANLAEAYIDEGDLESAAPLLELAEKVAADGGFKNLLSYVWIWQATILGQTGFTESAAQKFKAGIELARETEDYFSVSQNLLTLAKFEYSQGLLEQALATVDEALDICEEFKLEMLIVEMYQIKADCHIGLGDHAQAVQTLLKRDEVKEKQFNIEIEKQRQTLAITHQAETLKVEAELEKRKNAELKQQVADRTMALREALDQANMAKIAKDHFLAKMSHELRTPLNAIRGYGENIEEVMEQFPVSEDQEEVSHSLEQLLFATDQLLALVNDVLDFSELQQKESRLEVTTVELQPLLTQLQSRIQPRLEESGNRLQLFNQYPEAAIFTDGPKLSLILYNLLTNAVKFTDNGRIELRVTAEGDELIRFDLTDSGIGIDVDQLERIFEPFIQVEGAFNRKFEGSGLGLSICRQLTGILKGSLTVESRLGEGSHFKLVIPTRYT